ncbi:CdaR family protein [Deinococcus misasensis]|uniref:CdaR family protein n=1 Tax=Deinococcus misasensis TaxID=392413 RepID=UPI000558C290
MRIITHKLPQKLISLALALIIYFIATADQRATSERSYEVPVQVVDASPNASQRDVSDIPKTVRVTLSGPLNRLETLEADRIEVMLDVSNQPTGRFQSKLEVLEPSGTRLVGFTPQVVTGLIDQVVTVRFPVRVTHLNSSDDTLLRFTSNPNQVQITGPQNRVESIVNVITQPVTYEENNVRQVSLIPIDNQGHEVLDVRLMPRSVQVSRIDLGQLPVKTVPLKLAVSNDNFEVLSATFNPREVRVMGTPENLSKIDSVEATVPLKAGTYATQARLNLPEGYTALDRVSVTLSVKAKSTQQ